MPCQIITFLICGVLIEELRSDPGGGGARTDERKLRLVECPSEPLLYQIQNLWLSAKDVVFLVKELVEHLSVLKNLFLRQVWCDPTILVGRRAAMDLREILENLEPLRIALRVDQLAQLRYFLLLARVVLLENGNESNPILIGLDSLASMLQSLEQLFLPQLRGLFVA